MWRMRVQEPPIDDVPADLDQNARESGERNRLDVGAETQQERQQEQREYRARRPGLPAGADVGHRIHGSPGAGQSPMRPANALPTPWPMSSRSGSWLVRVSESATRQVSKLTTEPIRARMSAGSTALARKAGEGSPSCSPGRPVGTFPMTGASFSHKTPTSVPTTSPTRGVGRIFRNR